MGSYVTILPHVFDETLVSTIRSKLAPKATNAATAAEKEPVSLSANDRREIERKQELGVKTDQVGLMKFVGD